MKNIRTNTEKMREVLEDVTPEMPPGDYSDALANLVHYTFVEAERIGRVLNNNSAMVGIVRELEAISTLQISRRPSLH